MVSCHTKETVICVLVIHSSCIGYAYSCLLVIPLSVSKDTKSQQTSIQREMNNEEVESIYTMCLKCCFDNCMWR